MAQDDPLLQITTPRGAPPEPSLELTSPAEVDVVDDPLLQVVTPRVAPVDPLRIVENTDDTKDTEPGTSFGDMLKMTAMTEGLLKGAFRQQPRIELGKSERIIGALETIEQYGQAVQQSFRNAIPVFGEPAAQVTEEMVRVPSSVLQQTSKLYSDLTGLDEEDDFLFQLSETMRQSTRTPDELLAKENLADDFTRAFTQTVSFMLPAKAAANVLDKGGKAAGWIAGWLGAAVGGQAGREDAIRHGAEDWQVDLSYYLNSLFGVSEGAPVSVALSRLDDATGGAISRRIKSKGAQLTSAAIQGALTEGIQEGFQTFGENLTADDIAAYDPGRPLTEGLFEAGSIGGTVGLTVNLLTGAMGIRNRARTQAEIEEKILKPLGLSSMDELASFEFRTLDENYLDLVQQIAEQDELIASRTESEEVVAENFRRTTDLPAELPTVRAQAAIPPSKESQAAAGAAAIIPELASIKVNKELEGDVETLARIQQTPVTLALTKYSASREDIIAAMELRLEKIKPSKIPGHVAEQKEITEKIKISKALVKEEKKLARELKSLAAHLLPILPKSTRLLIDNYQIHTRGSSTATGGYDRFSIPKGPDVEIITLKTDKYLQAIGDNIRYPSESRAQRVRNSKARILSTFLHEFGHAIGFTRFQEIYHKFTRDEATEKDKQLWTALSNDYMKFVVENLHSPEHAAIAKIFSLPRAHSWLRSWIPIEGQGLESASMALDSRIDDMMGPFSSTVASRTADYLFSTTEYLAEEFAKVALNQGVEQGSEAANYRSLIASMKRDRKQMIKDGIDTTDQDQSIAAHERRLANVIARPKLLDGYFKDVVADITEALGLSKGRFRATTPTMEAYFKRHSLRQQLKTAGENIEKNVKTNPIDALTSDGLLSQEAAKRLTEETDVFNWFMDVGFNILQIAEQNPHIQGLQNYTEHLREWKNEVNNNLAIAEDRLTEWKNLGKKENEQLARLLLDETVGRKPDGGWLANPRNFTVEEIATYNLSDEALELRSKIKKDFRNSLQQMEDVLIAAKRELFIENQEEMQKEILKVEKEFKDMKARPYFPLMRFGEYIYQVRSRGEQTIDGKEYKEGELVDFQSFDTKSERDRAYDTARRQFTKNKTTASRSKMVIPNFSLQGMPLTLLEHLESKLVSAGISEEVRDAIREVKNDVLPFKSFRKQFQRRKRILGYSLDAQRTYANYMSSFANHIARVKFDSQFKDDFENVENSIKVINRREGGDSTKRAEILNHMNNHLQYVMNPVNEFVGLRSAAFFWFLGYNVKSAFVNLTQIPLVTYPYLATRFGDGRAVAQINRAYGTAIKSLAGKGKVSEDLDKMIQTGLKESWLDESLAQELALAASEGNLERTLPRKGRGLWMKISHYGSLPFHAAEKLNRHVTAIAAYRLAVSEGKSPKQATFEARRAVEKTQFEYARWARPRFMRGKLGGTVFVFQNYMQNALYFALGGDPGALRMMMMLFLVAGLQGLPFGDNIMDLVDAGMTALKRRAGMKDPHTAVRVDLRKLLKDLEIDPDLMLHGMSSSTFGLANIGEFMGWPIPDLDLSGSLSMGRIIPGIEMLKPGQSLTFEKAVARGAERTGGAIVSGFAGIGQAIFNSHPDQWKRWEKAFPTAMRQISKAARFATRGEEATRGGIPIAGFDMHDTRDQAEVVGQALGFTPREVSKGWEGFIAQQQAVIYYETWKTSLLRQWNYAKDTDDIEAVKDANVKIREYNSIVPFPEMKIGPDTRKRSFESYLRSRKFNEAEIEQSKSFRRLSSSIANVFEAGDSEDTE